MSHGKFQACAFARQQDGWQFVADWSMIYSVLVIIYISDQHACSGHCAASIISRERDEPCDGARPAPRAGHPAMHTMPYIVLQELAPLLSLSVYIIASIHYQLLSHKHGVL